MKVKKLIKLICAACVFAVVIGVFAACKPKKVDAEILKNISELSTNVYTANTEAVAVTLTTGEREAPYNVNGVSSSRSPYTIITVRPVEMPDDAQVYDYVLRAGKNEYRGKLNLHPFGISYTDTINKKAEGGVTLSLTTLGETEEIELVSQFTDKMLDWQDALSVGVKSVKAEVDSLYSDKKLLGEVYVRFTTDQSADDGEYFWYVAVVGNNGKTYGALVDPLSGDIIATKKI